MVKQFIDLQRPGIEALARWPGRAVQCSRRAGGFAVSADASAGREARSRRESRRRASSRSTSTRPIPSCATRPWQAGAGRPGTDPARQLQRRRAAPVAGLDQLALEQEVPGTQSEDAERPHGKAGGRDSPEHRAEDAPARHQRGQGAGRPDRQRLGSTGQVGAQGGARKEVTPGTRPYNFSAGPAAMPEAVLQRAAAEMLDWQGSGMSVMEMSHRGKEFGAICTQAEARHPRAARGTGALPHPLHAGRRPGRERDRADEPVARRQCATS